MKPTALPNSDVGSGDNIDEGEGAIQGAEVKEVVETQGPRSRYSFMPQFLTKS